MGTLARAVTVCCALAGGAATSQFPEYAQQYGQRLGGASDELRAVAEQFDKDALASNMTRDQALRDMSQSNSELVQDRSQSMSRHIQRYERLRGQEHAFQTAVVLARPLVVFSDPDPDIAQEAWQDFRPAVPLTMDGLTWGLFGALAAIFLVGLPSRLFRRRGPRLAPIEKPDYFSEIVD